jgi:hypothetical protein
MHRHLHRHFAAAAAAALSATALASANSTESLREYRTGHTFPLRRAESMYLLSCNTRCMLGWCRFPPARAYAFGLYMDKQTLAAAGALKRAAGAPDPARLVASLLDATEGSARRALSGGRGAPAAGPRVGSLSLVLVIARSIDGPHMARGFQQSIMTRYTTALKRDGGGGEENVLDALGGLVGAFSALNLAVGDEICFSWDAGGDGALRATLNGAPLRGAELRSAALSRALFEVYAGDGGVSARAVGTLRANLSAACEAEGGAEVERIVVAEHATRKK